MPRTYDPKRSCLHVDKWPEADRALWAAALTKRSPEDESEVGDLSRLSPSSVETLRKGYGRWINFLKRSGHDLELVPSDRVTEITVRRYLTILEGQGVKPSARCHRIRELLRVMQALAPDRDWGWLRRRYNRLHAIAAEDRHQKPLSLLTGDILGPALKHLQSLRQEDQDLGCRRAIEYRNWLMCASLCLMPIRLHNLANLSIDRHLSRQDTGWMIQIPASEMKGRRALTMPMPSALQRHFEYYLDIVRPILLAGRMSDGVWIGYTHRPMTEHGIYTIMTAFTREKLGVAVNPHGYRHIAATSTVMAAPQMTEAARALLGHRDSKVTKDYYILGESLTASRQHAALIGKLRRRLRVDLKDTRPIGPED